MTPFELMEKYVEIKREMRALKKDPWNSPLSEYEIKDAIKKWNHDVELYLAEIISDELS